MVSVMSDAGAERHRKSAEGRRSGSRDAWGDLRLIVFDLDDTLYREVDYVKSGLQAVARYLSQFCDEPADAIFERMWQEFRFGDRRHVFDRVIQEKQLQARVSVEDALSVYRQHRPVIDLCGDAKSVLKALRGKYWLGLITDGRPLQQRNKIEALGLAGLFDAIIVTDEKGQAWRKPSVEPFCWMMRRFHVLPRQCAYVGDNPAKDFVGPNRLGWLTVRIIRPEALYRDVQPAVGGEPAVTIRSLDELLGLLK